MTSSAWMSMPTRSNRSASAGGLPLGSPLVSDVTPTRAWEAGAATHTSGNKAARIRPRETGTFAVKPSAPGPFAMVVGSRDAPGDLGVTSL
jgi:hypothetical protein